MRIKVPPLSLYVHLPWCVRKCPYCDFNSHTAGENAPRGRYVAALLADISLEKERADDRAIGSIFIGGGTPSLFLPAEIGQIINAAKNEFEVAADCEITMHRVLASKCLRHLAAYMVPTKYSQPLTMHAQPALTASI
jgi:oxygen-independent coproporphyrinogen-3 oxidase